MKFGLFLAVLVLLAATNVYGQGKTKGGRRVRPDTTTNEEIHSSEKKNGDHDVVDTKTKDRKDFDTKPEDRKDFGTKTEDRKDFDTKAEGRKDFGTKAEGRKDFGTKTEDRKDFDTKTEDRTRDETSVPSDVTGKKVIVTKVETTVPVDGTDGKHVVTKVETSGRPDRFRHDKVDGEGHQAANKLEEDEHEKLPTDKHLDKDEDDKKVDIIHKHKVDLVDSRGPIKSVHVHGTITLVKYPSSVVDSVQYDLDGSLSTIDSVRPFRPVLPFARDYLARGSHVTFYVSTTKTNDPKSAFAKFPIFYKKDNFPLTFELDIDLPEKQRGLLERADITLYFFVYITDSERLIETFVPAGYSQILLQGTNRNIHPLEVYVRANGLEVNGLFRGRFGERFIEPGTVFQVLVVDEKTLGQKLISTTDAIAQLTLSNIPSMFPVPFSFLVHYQMIKPKTKYFAVSYIVEKGVRRLINHEPIWLISEERVLATTQLIFTVVPYPFILKGRVTRSMPGAFVVQPGSSLGLNIRTIGSNEPDIVFRIPEITMLPQYFQINVTESTRFDPSQNYEVTAQITDKNNNIYMISSQPIPILDDIDKIIIPVDDYLYYVQVRLQSSTGQELTYIPGSTARILLTETPETPSKPLTSMAIKLVEKNFHEFTLTIPTTSVLRNRNYYLVMMIEINGVITHVSKTLLISNSQRPPLLVQLPVLSLNFIRGVISDIDHRQAQWSSSSISKLYLLDDTIPDPEKAIVQSWRIHLENDFPIRFEVQLDFSRLDFSRTYRLQSAIENGRGKIEYRPATSAVAVGSRSGIRNDVRVFVRNVKTSQLVRGIIHIDGVTGPLPEKGELIIQVSTTPSIINPRIVDEFRINVENRTLPVDFHFELSLRKFDLNAVYYFLVRYAVRGSVVIPVSQVFAFAPRNQATLVIRLSRTPQIAISGQVTSTGSALDLPVGTTLHLYVTDNLNEEKPFIYSEVFLQSTSNSLYEFTMLVDSLIVQKKIPLYLRADILYEDRVILRMPRPALMQLTSESTWNINLVIDLPTLIVGEIVSVSSELKVTGEFDAYLYVVESVTKQIVHTVRLRLNGKLPTKFRIELDNSLFLKNPDLKLRAIIKNCREEILYESGGDISIHVGLNLETKLTVTVKDIKKLTEIRPIIDETASFYGGSWKLVVTGVTSTIRTGELITTTTSFRK